MAQAFSINSPSWHLEHIRRTQRYGERVRRFYEDAIADAVRIAATLKPDPTRPFLFEDYPGAKKQADKLIETLVSEIISSTHEATAAEWEIANKKNDAFVKSILATSKIDEAALARYMQRNTEALKAFQTRKVGGMNLSKRVWQYGEQFRKEIELGLDIGLGEGRSAAQLSRDLRQNLRQPDKLFRRVRDKWGVLQLSKAAKAYNPGRGVYRSSYKNAFRMTRTEVNMAYRTSDHLRWNQLPFVVGIQVKVSNNHPVPDICDDLQGRYPKDFLFRGWHPQCRCNKFSILASPDEVDAMEQALIRGDDPLKVSSVNAVAETPQGFKNWVKRNEAKLKAAKSPPYFVTDNPGAVAAAKQ